MRHTLWALAAALILGAGWFSSATGAQHVEPTAVRQEAHYACYHVYYWCYGEWHYDGRYTTPCQAQARVNYRRAQGYAAYYKYVN